MLTAFRLTHFVSFMLACGSAVSQAPGAGPELAVGESWTYQAHDRHFDEGAFTIEVSEKASNGYVLSSKDVTAKRPSLIPSGLTLDLNWLRAAADGPAASCWFSFPLSAGKIWACKTPWVNQNGHQGEDSFTFKVVGTEKITVKGGTFDTIKIVGEGRWKNNSTGDSDKATITIWFAPEAHGMARYQRDNWPKIPDNPQTRLELVRHVAPR